jgi:hypothetical protein
VFCWKRTASCAVRIRLRLIYRPDRPDRTDRHSSLTSGDCTLTFLFLSLFYSTFAMSQWGQGQTGYQYPLQTGYPPSKSELSTAWLSSGRSSSAANWVSRPAVLPFSSPSPLDFQEVALHRYPSKRASSGSFQQQQLPPVPPVPRYLLSFSSQHHHRHPSPHPICWDC